MAYLPKKKRAKLIQSWQPKHINKIYSSKRWVKARLSYLKRHPLCIQCKKIDLITKATVVDHIDPIQQGGSAWDEMNWQPLCYVHHAKKTAREGRIKV